MEKWGLGPEALLRLNPRLIIARMSGYGQYGPYSDRAGFGGIGEAMGGWRYIVGEPDRPPSRMGISIGDTLTATYGCMGVLAALHVRTQTGKGQVIDTALYEAVLQVMESVVPEYDYAGIIRERSGSFLPGIAPSNVYRCTDGEFMIGANNDAIFTRFCAAIKRPELASDDRYATHIARGRNQIELDALINEWTSRHSVAEVEYKMDGARIQVHRRADDVRVYTRTGNDVTGAVPEVVELARSLTEPELVLDGEVLALRADGKPYPFQETMRRFGRKLDVDAMRQTLPLSAFFFDCLYSGGRSLLDAPTRERIAILEAIVPATARVPRLVTNDKAAAESFTAGALAAGHEGVMAKACDAPYAAGKRGANWLKIKRAHTLDLVVLAAEWGSGRRKGWLSNLHLGALEAQTGQFVMLGKTFKGLTDELLKFQTQALLERETHRDTYTVHVRPELVVEIAVSEL